MGSPLTPPDRAAHHATGAADRPGPDYAGPAQRQQRPASPRLQYGQTPPAAAPRGPPRHGVDAPLPAKAQLIATLTDPPLLNATHRPMLDLGQQICQVCAPIERMPPGQGGWGKALPFVSRGPSWRAAMSL